MADEITQQERQAMNNIMALVIDCTSKLQRYEGENSFDRGLLGNMAAWSAKRPDTDINVLIYQNLDAIAAALCATLPIQPLIVTTSFLRCTNSFRNNFKNWGILRDMAIEHYTTTHGEVKVASVFRGLTKDRDNAI